MALQEKVFLNRDNAIKLGLTADGTPVNASTLTRVEMILTDSDGNVYEFDSSSAQVVDTVTGILIIKLQDSTSPPPTADDYVANLILYDSANPNGIHWDSPFPLEVINE